MNPIAGGMINGDKRPETVIPGFQLYFRFAAEVTVRTEQSVLTLSASS